MSKRDEETGSTGRNRLKSMSRGMQDCVVKDARAKPSTPEHRLLLAIIAVAITDTQVKAAPWSEKVERHLERLAAKACTWLRDSGGHEWSFRWCLDALGCDPDSLQRETLRQLDNGTLPTIYDLNLNF